MTLTPHDTSPLQMKLNVILLKLRKKLQQVKKTWTYLTRQEVLLFSNFIHKATINL